MHVLVTGGVGYLGSILVPRLLAAGHRVTVIDNFLYGQGALLDCCHDERLAIVRGDARDRRLVAEHLKRADAVLPLACLTGAPACDRDPVAATSVNLDAVRMILEVRSREQWIVFPTTNSGYGIGETGIHCTEETPLRPVSLYGRLKVDAEKMLLDSPNTVTLRFATVFGISPRMRLDLLVNDFTYRAVTDRFIVLFEAHFKRNYLHVLDAARAFLHCLDRFETVRGQPYNVGLDEANLSKAELCEVIKAQVPAFYWVEADVGKDPDQRNYVVSNAKIARTGYTAEVSLERGVAELIKGFQVIRRAGYSNV
jgi:nucleoside-diphosphate-sugar epimerase